MSTITKNKQYYDNLFINSQLYNYFSRYHCICGFHSESKKSVIIWIIKVTNNTLTVTELIEKMDQDKHLSQLNMKPYLTNHNTSMRISIPKIGLKKVLTYFKLIRGGRDLPPIQLKKKDLN